MTAPADHPAPLPQPEQLPHGEGFRFVTAVDARTIDDDGTTRGKGHWDLTGDEPFFNDHFPTRPVLPGVLLIEAIAQFSGLIHFADRPEAQGAAVGIAAVDIRLMRPVLPPATVTLEAVSRESVGPLTRFDVSASVDGKKIARGSLHLTAALQEPKA